MVEPIFYWGERDYYEKVAIARYYHSYHPLLHIPALAKNL